MVLQGSLVRVSVVIIGHNDSFSSQTVLISVRNREVRGLCFWIRSAWSWRHSAQQWTDSREGGVGGLMVVWSQSQYIKMCVWIKKHLFKIIWQVLVCVMESRWAKMHSKKTVCDYTFFYNFLFHCKEDVSTARTRHASICLGLLFFFFFFWGGVLSLNIKPKQEVRSTLKLFSSEHWSTHNRWWQIKSDCKKINLQIYLK